LRKTGCQLTLPIHTDNSYGFLCAKSRAFGMISHMTTLTHAGSTVRPQRNGSEMFGGWGPRLALAAVLAMTFCATFAAPSHAADTPPFRHPGVYELADGTYEADIATDASRFYPSTIEVPDGRRVRFVVTSPHLMRGFAIAETGVYMSAGPGWVKPASYEFDRPDTYLLVCSLHCGLEHMDMYAKILVVPSRSKEAPLPIAHSTTAASCHPELVEGSAFTHCWSNKL
jgi:cytochrome c oxidase subunit II